MKTTITTALLMGAIAVGAAQNAARQDQPKLQPVTLAVTGMTCGGCVSAVQSGIATLKPIEGLAVSLEQKTARLKFDAEKAPLQDLTNRASQPHGSMQFTAKVAFVLSGTDAQAKNSVAAIKKVEGVTGVTGPDKDGRIEVALDPKKKTMYAAITKAAKGAGATLADLPKPKDSKE